MPLGLLYPSYLASEKPVANDTVTISFNRRLLLKDTIKMESAPLHLIFRNVVRLLRIIHHTSERYGLASENCWWFAWVLVDNLHRASGNKWNIKPGRNLMRKTLWSLGSNTREATKRIMHQFSNMQSTSPPIIPPVATAELWEGTHVRDTGVTYFYRSVTPNLGNSPFRQPRRITTFHPSKHVCVWRRSFWRVTSRTPFLGQFHRFGD